MSIQTPTDGIEADARLDVLLLEGLASGDPIPVDEKFWTELRAEAERRVEARKTSARENKQLSREN